MRAHPRSSPCNERLAVAHQSLVGKDFNCETNHVVSVSDGSNPSSSTSESTDQKD
jgi:hypothetical protein